VDWRFIRENWLIKRFKNHPLYLFFGPMLGWVMSNFLTTPTITSIAIVLLVYLALVILLEVWIKSKICKWMSDSWCYCTIYGGFLIICILVALFFWNDLVYVCDRNNPYKQPLRTGTADVDIIINSKNIITPRRVRTWGDWGPLAIGKDGDMGLFMELSLPSIRYEEINPNQFRFMGTLILNTRDKYINKPIADISKADFVLIRFDNTLSESNVIGGDIVFSFNGGSVQVTIPIPSQPIENKSIIIEYIEKYFKK
jgi:hypothetical protein